MCQQGWSMLHLSFLPQWQNQKTQSGRCLPQSLHRRQFQSPSKRTEPGRTKRISIKHWGQVAVSKPLTATCLEKLRWQILMDIDVILLWCFHLNWNRRRGVDEGASGQPTSSTWISQEGNRGQTGWEHAGTNRREHSGWTPSDLLGLVRQEHQRKKEISGANKSYCLMQQNVFEGF